MGVRARWEMVELKLQWVALFLILFTFAASLERRVEAQPAPGECWMVGLCNTKADCPSPCYAKGGFSFNVTCIFDPSRNHNACCCPVTCEKSFKEQPFSERVRGLYGFPHLKQTNYGGGLHKPTGHPPSPVTDVGISVPLNMTEVRNPAEDGAMGAGTDSKEGDFHPEEFQSSISAGLPVEGMALGAVTAPISSDSEDKIEVAKSSAIPASFFADGEMNRHLLNRNDPFRENQRHPEEFQSSISAGLPVEGMALGAVTALISSDSEDEIKVAESLAIPVSFFADGEMNRHLLNRNDPFRENQRRRQLKDVEAERLMDRRMYTGATQGHVGEFIRIVQLISWEKELQHPQILYQVSPQRNTCLHIAASFGHRELADYILGQCPDLIEEKNSRGDTALHIAARRKDLSFVKLVIEYSCPSGNAASRDVEKAEHSLLRIVNEEENTVLHEALINHCQEEEVVEVLIKKDPQLAYYPNMQAKSPLYLAAAAHFFHVVEAIQECKLDQRVENSGREAKPAVYGAIWGKNKEMLEKILEMEPLHPTNEHGITPLHYAAWIGFHEGVQHLLDRCSLDGYKRDSQGFCPIHVASQQGHLDFVKELLNLSPDSKELLSEGGGGNFLHVAAMFGRENIVEFVLKEKGLEKLINEKDRKGDTPLHLATMSGHAEVVCSLTWDRRVDVNLVNYEGRTAFEIATSTWRPSFHQRLIWVALKSAGAKPPPESMVRPHRYYEPPNPLSLEFKDRVNTLMLVSTLVATVTFAAGFTVPGGNNDDSGMATLLTRQMFHLFVICNTIALYTSVTAVITLIWAQLGDLNLMGTAMSMALPLLGTAITAVCLAFMAGVYLVVSNLYWLAIAVLVIGSVSLVSLLIPFLLFFLPTYSTNCIIRFISYYPFRILIWASSPRIKRED